MLAAWLMAVGFSGFIAFTIILQTIAVVKFLDTLCHTRQQEQRGMSMQRVTLDPIPFLVLFGLIVLIVWLWRRFRGR